MKRNLIRKLATVVLVLLSALVQAENETKPVEFTLAAGPVDRENSPVRVLITAPDTVHSATVTSEDGKTFPADVVAPSLLSGAAAGQRELVFILPSLKSGQSATFKAALATAAGEGFKWVETPGDNIELSYKDRKVLRYWCKTYDETPANREATYKVFHQMYDPAGQRLVNKGPGGKFTHHRGVFYGFNKIAFGTTKCDIWHCTNGTHQSHGKVVQSEAGAVIGRHLLLINWVGPDKATFAEELRELTIFNTPGGTLLEFQSRVTSKVGTVTVGGDPQHAGFHFRAHLDVADKTEADTYFIRPDGVGKKSADMPEQKPGKDGKIPAKLAETRNWTGKDSLKSVNLPWNGMSFVVGDKRYTAGYLDHPSNPKEARYSERTYGRFGSYFESEFTNEKPLDVRYRIWLQDDAASIETLTTKSTDFATPITATLK